MTIGEVIRLFKVSESTLKRWEATGVIPKPNRRPSRWREYDEECIKAIEAYLKGKQTTNSPAPQT